MGENVTITVSCRLEGCESIDFRWEVYGDQILGLQWGDWHEDGLSRDLIITAADGGEADLQIWLPPEKHRSESFRFIREDKLVDELSEMIEKAQARHDRIGLFFTTANGRASEPIRGILTAWDVAGVR